jgi:CheY-like chemotaxis protein
VHILSKPLHILIADDDLEDLYLFDMAAHDISSNIIVTPANDGEALFRLLEKLPLPHTIVLDMQMPLKDGRECLKAIRHNQAFKDVNVVVLTNHEEYRADCLLYGANKFILKPSTYVGLSEVIRTITEFQPN